LDNNQKNSENMEEVKTIDRKILRLIQDEGLCVPRITKIAHKLNLPSSTVQSRIKKMESLGVIKECTVLLDPEKLNKGFTAFILGQAKLGKDMDLDKAGNLLAKIPHVQEVFFIVGDYDYMVKIRVKDREEYYEVIKKIGKCFEVRGKGILYRKYGRYNPIFL